MSAGDKSIPLPIFSGKEDDYLMWKGKMKGFAMAKGIWTAVTQKAELPSKESDNMDPTTQAVGIQARQANSLLMAYLMNAFKKPADTKIVLNMATSDWPSGKAHEVFEKFDAKYNPKDLQTDVELERKLQQVSMKEKEDPENLFDQIENIATWYDGGNRKLEESKKLAVIMSKAHDEYQSVLATEATTKGNALAVDDLQKVMKTYYRNKYGVKESGSDGKSNNNGEFQLLVIPGLENMKCHMCKQKGHKAAQCPNKKRGARRPQNGRFQGNCNLCGKKGHKAEDCWSNPKNASKRPNWYKGNTEEVTGANVDTGSKIEFNIANIDVDWCAPCKAEEEKEEEKKEEKEEENYDDLPELIEGNDSSSCNEKSEGNDPYDSFMFDEDYYKGEEVLVDGLPI